MDESYEIVVVGGGPAGLAAACAAAESGRKVALVDDTPWLGGQIWRGQQANPSNSQALCWLKWFARSGAKLLDRTSVISSPSHGVLQAEHEDGPRTIRWQKLILATGARELFLPFPGWTMPNVMGAGGLQALVKHGWPIGGRGHGQLVVVAGSGPLLLAVADYLQAHGATVAGIYEQAPWSKVMGFGAGLWRHPAKLLQGLQMKRRLLGVQYRCGVWPVRVDGDARLATVTVTDGRRTWVRGCTVLACGFGLVPNVELPLALGCELKGGFVRVNEFQATSVPDVFCAGEPTGVGGADCALVEGQIAGYAVSGQADEARRLFRQRASWHRFRESLARTFALRPELKRLAEDETLVCRCEDVSFGRLKQYKSWREAKLQTRCGMGACQGRICGAATKEILGWGMESVRPPILPARVGSLISPS